MSGRDVPRETSRRVRVAKPLPECGQCERPMTRERHAETGGFCADCRPSLVDVYWRELSDADDA